MYRFAILLGLPFLLSSLYAQVEESSAATSYLNELYLPQNGLPVSNVTQVFQCGDGFIWMASYNGLLRFDGLRYKHYTIKDYPELGSNRIISIHAGQNGGFWLVTSQYHLINYQDGKFKHYGPYPGEYYQRVILDGDSLTWILASHGLILNRGSKWIEMHPEGLEDGQSIIAFIRLNNGDLLLETNDGSLYTMSYPYNKIASYQKLSNNTLGRSLWKDKDEGIWHFNKSLEKIVDGALIKPQGIDQVAERWSEFPPLFYGAHQLKDGRIFFRAETGLFTIENMEIKAVQRDSNPEIPTEAERIGAAMCTCQNGDIWSYVNDKVFLNGEFQFKANDEPTSIFCDRENNIWLSLTKKGVQRFREASIRTYVAKNGHNNFYGVYKDSKGQIWMGEWFRYLNYLKDGQLTSLEYRAGNSGATASFLEAFDGKLYVGNRYLEAIDVGKEHKDFSTFKQVNGIENDVYSIIQSKDSTIWFGANYHLYTYKNNQVDTVSLPDKYHPVRFMLEEEDGHIWMATNGAGVYRYEPNQKKWEHFDESNGLSSNHIRALLLDENKQMWIANEETGLDRIELSNNKISNISSEQGLYQNQIHSMQLDHYGRMWMSTNQGVFYVDKQELESCLDGKSKNVESFIYTEQNGMLNREANGGFQNSSFCDENGMMWYPTQEGAISINPNNNSYDQSVFNLSINEIKSGGNSYVKPDDHFTMPEGSSNLQVIYSAPSFIAPARTNYRYKLEGFDLNWHEVNGRNEAIYTNIPSGEYTFVVQALSIHSSEVKSETRLRIFKPLSLVETPWFKAILVLAILLLLYIIHRFRLRRLEAEKSRLNEQMLLQTKSLETVRETLEKQNLELATRSHEKTEFLNQITSELQIPISLILKPLSKLDRELGRHSPLKANLDEAIDNSKKLQRIIQQICAYSDLQEGMVKYELMPRNLNDYIKGILPEYEAMAEQKDIEFTVAIPNQKYVVNFDEFILKKAFQNLLSNAISFTANGGHIQVKLFKAENKVIFCVSDSGPGIKPEQLLTIRSLIKHNEKLELKAEYGLGLSIAHAITLIHGGEMEVESKLGVGSNFRIILPLDQSCHEKLRIS